MERLLCSWIGTLNIEDVKTIQKKKNQKTKLTTTSTCSMQSSKKSRENLCGNRKIHPKIHMESQET